MTAQRILVIDDELSMITFCQKALEKEGFEMEGALTGEEGLRLLHGRSFDLTLLDIRLPDLDGLDVLSTIRERDPEMAVIIITGYGTMETATRALKLGAHDFLLKPFTVEELVTSTQNVLEKERLIQENLRLKARLPILEISKALMSEVNFERLTQLVLETVQQELRADRVSLMLLDEERQELFVLAALGLPDDVVATMRVEMEPGLAGLTVQRRKPILVPEQAENDPIIQALIQSDIGSAICTPLMLKKRVLGVLNASRLRGSIPFRQDDVDLLSILSGQIAVAIANARLFEQAQEKIAERKRAEWTLDKRLKELTCLYMVNRDIFQEQLPIDELCRRAIEHLVPSMQFPEITVPVIELDDRRFTSERYTEGLWRGLHAEINVGGETRGHLWVYYTQDKPFLIPWEQNLLNAVAETMGLWLERKQVD